MGAAAPAMTASQDPERLALELEVAELRQQLAETQEQCVELAIDAGELHAENMALRQELARMYAERDRADRHAA
jgi:regulator of replication initiation timing